MLTAERLVKRYGSTPALDGFSLGIEPGEIVGLVGHNGAGKTTFVEIVAGLARPDSGRVTIDGYDVAEAPREARRRIGLAPQEIGLYLSLTVRENVLLFARMAGLRGKRLRSAIDTTLDALGLAAVCDRPVGLLSGGQRRRTQAATALAHRPPLLLLDEPTAGADPGTRQALLQLVRDYAAEGSAVCYTTHYLPELADLDATVAVVSRGRVIARGTQDQLLDGLPSTVTVTLADGQRQSTTSSTPTQTVSSMITNGSDLRAVDIHRPSLDDLYHALEQRP